MHRFYCRQILGNDTVQRPAPRLDIAEDAAEYPHIRVRIHKDLDVHQPAELLLGENQDALKDQDRGRMYDDHLIRPVVL